MKILLISIGTRGDIEPFIAIAEILKANNHEVVCAFPEQFRQLTESLGISFHALTPEFLNLLHSKDGEVVMGGGKNLFEKAVSFIRLAKQGMKVNKVMMVEQQTITSFVQPDLIIHHNKAVYPLYSAVMDHIPQKIVSPVPYIVHRIKGYPHLGFPKSILGINIEKLSYKIANFGLLSFVHSWAKKLKNREKVDKKALKKCLKETPLIYTISPTLFSGEVAENSPVKVLGYHEKSGQSDMEESPALLKFVDQHKKVMLITFGSMTNPWPEKITRLFCQTLEGLQIPAIINTAYGGLIKLEDYKSDHIHFEENLNYHKILPKIYAFIHHGGSGTTHLGIKYGCATMIIPHIVDQFMWNQLISEKGAGPIGIKINKLNYKRLNAKVKDLWTNSTYKTKAHELSKEMQKEDLKNELIEALLK